MQTHHLAISSGLVSFIASNADAQSLNDELARLRAENERLRGVLQEIADTPAKPSNHDLVAVVMLAQYTIWWRSSCWRSTPYGMGGMDLVERLRSRAYEHRHHRKYREEAAREIDALRAEVARLTLAAGEAPQNIRFYRNGKRVESLFGPEIGLPVTTTAPPSR